MLFSSVATASAAVAARRGFLVALTRPRVRALSSLHSLTSTEELVRETASNFAKHTVAPLVAATDAAERTDPSIISGLFDAGLMGIEIPSKYGGSELNITCTAIAIEELAKIDPAVSVLVESHNVLAGSTLSQYGSEDLKAKYLPKLANGTVGSFCLSEPSSGSDAFALKTTAIKQDDGDYLLNGTKAWITNSGEAGVFLVFANVDPSKGYKGITCFLVERNSPGFTVGPPEKKLGIRSSSTCMLTFEDVRVPPTHIVGELGKGYKIAMNILNEGRIGIAAQMLGIAQGAYDVALPYMFERKQFGQYIGTFQGMQHQYAQIATEIEAARLLTYNAARLKEEGNEFAKEAAMAKLYASNTAVKAATKAVEWMGGVGFIRDVPAENFYRSAIVGLIYEGSSNMILNTIAKHVAKQYAPAS